MITRFGDLFLLLSFFIFTQSFSQPTVCGSPNWVSGADINFTGSSMYSPSVPFINNGGLMYNTQMHRICQSNGTVTISVTNVPAGYSIAWFRDDTPTNIAVWPNLPPVYLGTTNSLTTNVPAFDSQYILLAYYYNNSTGCIDRASENPSVGHMGGLRITNYGDGASQLSNSDFVPNPSCEGDIINVTDPSPRPYNWDITFRKYLYTNSSLSGSGQLFNNTISGLSAGTYYATLTWAYNDQCKVNLPPAVITVNPRPNGPTSASATPNTFCSGGTSTLSGVCPSGTVVWYTNSSGTGSPIPGGSSPTVSPSWTQTYFAFCDDGVCQSDDNLSVTVNVIDPSETPSFPSASPNSGCNPYSTNLTAYCPSGATVRWYTTPTGTGVGIGSPYYVTTSQTVYARCYYSSAPPACQYSNPSSVNLTVTTPPSNAVSASASPSNGCIPFNTTLSANCGAYSVRWYTTPTGTGAGISSSQTINSIGSTTFYARCYNSSGSAGCQYSLSATSVTVTGYSQPNSPTSVSATNNNLCPGYTTTLSGNCSSGSLRWYTSPTGTGAGLTMPYTVNSNVTLYGKCFSNTNPSGCQFSNGTSINLTVSSSPTPPTSLAGSPNNGCGNYTSTLTGTCASGTLRWYTTPNSTGSGLSMPVTVTPTNTTFYAKCFNSGFPVGCQYSSVDSLQLAISSPVTPIITGPNNICVNSSATYTSSHNPGSWFIASGGSLATISTGGVLTSFGNPGNIQIGFSYPNGACVDTGYFNVTINPSPVINLNDTSACFGNTIQLSPQTSGGTYMILSGPGSITAGGLFSSPIAGTTRLYYNINSGGCNASDTIDITIYPLPSAPVLYTNSDTICLGDSVILSGTCSGSTIHWYDNNLGVGSPLYIGFNTTILPLTSDTLYAFCYDSVSTCGSDTYDSLILVVNPCRDTIVSTIPSNGCGDTIILPTNRIPGTVDYISTCDGLGMTANGDTITFLNDSTIVFRPSSYPFLGDSACIIICNSSIPLCDTTYIYFQPDTTMPPVTSPSITCYDDTVFIDGSGMVVVNPANVANVDFQCFNGDVWLSLDTFYCDNIGVHNIWIYAANSFGGIDSCQSTITVLDSIKPTLNCPAVVDILVEDICEYIIPNYTNLASDNCGDSLYIYQTPIAGTIISLSQLGVRNYIQRVEIYVSDASNNRDSCYFDIEIACDINFNIPQFISPNGDNQNDLWIIENIELYPQSRVQVFNRWGGLVYEMENYDNSWDGKSNQSNLKLGNDYLPSGTYYYVIDKGDGENTYTGYLYLRK